VLTIRAMTDVSAAHLADLLACSTKTIRDYAARRIVTRVGHGQFDLEASVRGVVAHLRELARGRGDEGAIAGVSVERRRLLRSLEGLQGDVQS
jgi:phage terminase Nu1 subunit (DNA packaging protein)